MRVLHTLSVRGAWDEHDAEAIAGRLLVDCRNVLASVGPSAKLVTARWDSASAVGMRSPSTDVGVGVEPCAQVRRPNNYDVNVAVMLGPTEPDPTMDLSQLDIVKTVVQDSPHKLFIGGLPCDWNEDQASPQLLGC